MIITHRLSLDVLRDGSQANCLLVQGEAGARAIAVTLRRGSEPIPMEEGMTAVFRGRKPDGTELYNSCLVYTRAGVCPDTIVYTVTGATVACPGVYTARFVVSDALGATLYSPEVTVKVVANPLLDSELESRSEYTLLQEAAAEARAYAYRAEEAVKELEQGAVEPLLAAHNTDTVAHNDLRLSLGELEARLSALADSDDVTLDQMREIVAYIKANRSLIEGVTTDKISVSELVNDLITNRADRPLTAAQGVALKALIDALARDKADAAHLDEALGAALAEIKASGELDGSDGKSAYDYAREGGFAGTEAEFAQRLASGEATPDYIVAEAERVAKSVQATRTAHSLVFPVLSDMHLYAGSDLETHADSMRSAHYAGMGIAELKKRMHLDFVGYLGDYTCGSDNHTVEQVIDDITAFKRTTDPTDKEIWCVGNHDRNYISTVDRALTVDEAYGYIGANSDGVKPYDNIERGYGYLDFDNQRIRVIYLNTCDAEDHNERIGSEQLRWLADVALDFSDKVSPSEWGIVIVGHHPLHYAYAPFAYAMRILEAYKNGTSGSVANTVDGVTTTVPYDFTAVTERAEIICNIHGHTHNCGFSQISSTTMAGTEAVKPWLWRFAIPQICADRYNTGYENFKTNPSAAQRYGEFDEDGDPVYWYKESGTAKATSFCVVSIDRKSKTIYAYIFGAGVDRVLDYSEPAFINQIPISTDASGAVYNGKGYKESTKISSSNGADTSGASVAVGYIPIEEAEGEYNERGEWVIHLKDVTVTPSTDGNTRVALYGVDKAFIAATANNTFVSADADTGQGVPVYTVGEDGYLSTIDITGWRYNQQKTKGKVAAFLRVCAPGLDGDSVITINQPIV